MGDKPTDKDHSDGLDDHEDDKGGEGGKGGTGGGGSGFVPSYYDLLGVNIDETELTKLAAQALQEQRISIKAQGYEVTALSKLQQARNRLNDPTVAADLAANGINLEQHPELADMDGAIDPNTIVLPESEAAERASNDPKLQNKLRSRLAAKLGMSSNISLQSMQEEYKKKMEQRIRPTPGDELRPGPRIRPTNAPKPRPH